MTHCHAHARVGLPRLAVLAIALSACRAGPESPPPKAGPPVADPDPAYDECAEMTLCFDTNSDAMPKDACAEECTAKGGPSCRSSPLALRGQSCDLPGGEVGTFMTCLCKPK